MFIFFEATSDEKFARMREKRLKYNGNAIKELKKRIGLLPADELDGVLPSTTFLDAKSGAGFTFLELLIVISLISFLSLVGIASFVEYSRVQTLNSAAQDVVTMLQKAKSRAQTQVKPCPAADVLHGYRVSICAMPIVPNGCLAVGNNYELVARCGGPTESNANRIPIERKLFPSGISFDTTAPSPQTDTASFLFTVLKGSVINSSNTSIGTIVIRDSSSPPKTKQITVDSLGNISVN